MNSSSKLKIVLVWLAFIAITALVVVMLCIRLNEVKTFDDYKDIEKSNLVIKDIVGQDETEYYVFIYSSKDDYDYTKKEALEDVITRYFTFAHQNEDDETVTPIYAYDITKFKAGTEYDTCKEYLTALNSSINISDAPILVLVSEGAVSSVYSNLGGSSGIEATLSNVMQDYYDAEE